MRFLLRHVSPSTRGAFPSLVARAALAATLTAAAAPLAWAAPAPARPAYQFLRWQENWSVLPKLTAAPADPFDPVKFIKLSDDGSSWLSLGGDLRVRWEDWNNFNFGAPPTASHDDDFVLTRYRAHADAHFGSAVRLFTEIKGAYCTDRNLPGGVRPVDEDTFELQQCFLDFRFDLGDDATLVLRPGRQAFGFGAQRLVSALPWANSLRTWDGAAAIVSRGPWTVTAFGGAFVPVDPDGVGSSNDDEMLYGLYARRVAPGAADGLELYVLRNDWDQPRAFNGTVGADKRWTLGLRNWGALGARGDYEIEADYQFGETGPGDVGAWSFAGVVGYQLREDKTLRLWAGLDWASGDHGAGGDVQTFNQLYPLGHAYFGAIDMIGRQNIIDTSAGLTWKPRKTVTVALGLHSFRADSADDAIYNAGGGVVRAGGSYDSTDVGLETDLVVTWNAARHVTLSTGLGRLFAGDAIDESGPSEDIDFAYGEVTFTF